jgi:hypothetical protein
VAKYATAAAPFEQQVGIVDFVPELRARYLAVRMWLSIPSGKVLSPSHRGHFDEYHRISAGDFTPFFGPVLD